MREEAEERLGREARGGKRGTEKSKKKEDNLGT
jgi:hypothetical protein